jgi:outer membrane lipoprotein-sorting protein
MYQRVALLSALAVLTGQAVGLTGSEVLDRVREATVAVDRTMEADLVITDRNDRVQARTMRSMMLGDEKIMVTFTEPAELAGVTFMSTSAENMWIYLPTLGKVRRLSGSMVDQGFGGSDFSYEEMANISATGADEVVGFEEVDFAGTPAYLLTLQDGAARSRLWVEQERFLPLQVEKLGVDGRPVKRAVLADFVERGGIMVPQRITMHDLNKGSRTDIRVREFEVNTGIRDSDFTEANMKRGA